MLYMTVRTNNCAATPSWVRPSVIANPRRET